VTAERSERSQPSQPNNARRRHRQWMFTGAALTLLGLGIWIWSSRTGPDGAAATADRGQLAAAESPAHVTGAAGTAGAKARIAPPRFVTSEGRTPPKYKTVADTWMAQNKGPSIRQHIDFYEEQTRVEPWATAMQKAVSARFSPDVLRGLGLTTMALDQIDCRQSACRLDISWAEADLEAAKRTRPDEKYWPDPGAHLTLSTGPLASVEGRVRPGIGEVVVPNTWHVRKREDGRYAVTTVLLFGQQDVDPLDYDAFVRRSQSQRMAELAAARR
jgi:hypothetical protein